MPGDASSSSYALPRYPGVDPFCVPPRASRRPRVSLQWIPDRKAGLGGQGMEGVGMEPVVLVAAGYLLGSVLPAEFFVRWKTGRTPHEFRDNPGGGGAWRLAGPLPG
jgi:hypothetical protein